VNSLSEDLRVLSIQLMKLSRATDQEHDTHQESVYSYYYSKGALDYRDKLLEAIGALPRDRSVVEAFHILLATFPDEYKEQ
jgi:hypothetical protein